MIAKELVLRGNDSVSLSLPSAEKQSLVILISGQSNRLDLEIPANSMVEVISFQQDSSQIDISIKCLANSSLRFIAIHRCNVSGFSLAVNLEGDSSSSEVSVIALAANNESIMTLTKASHSGRRTRSSTLYRAVLIGESRSDYHGIIRIAKGGNGSDAFLDDHTLLMGNGPKADSIPSLDIDCNDVKAGHSAAMGTIDEEHLFYLQSRGISPEQAVELVVDGFVNPVVDSIECELGKKLALEFIKAKKELIFDERPA